MKTLILLSAQILTCAALAACTASRGNDPAASRAATRPAADANLQRFEYVAPKMGTVFSIFMYAPDKAVADRAADAVWARVDELNRIFSDYDPSSELSRLSQQTLDGPMAQPVPVSEDMYRLMEYSLDAAKESEGTFDITVGPLVRLWRRSRELHQVPAPERVEEAKKSVGYRFLKLDPEHHAVQLLAPRMRLDVGGIAKGYTSREALKVLRKFGIDRALVGAAGDLSVGQPPPGKERWTVALASLEPKGQTPATYANLQDYGVSTSGDTERFVIIDGVRYSHIIDPATGLGLTDRICVNAIAPDDTVADWLAAAVCIMGPEKGLALIERTPGAAARITKIEGDHVRAWESRRFHEFAGASR
ncbi:MAG: thiamine biosynthesis lipoprotein ApbE [Phycisphaerales bacterium]|nr:thiamine biosynthesis lipoprotein ApbE [Phycisphaerales bacterium]